MQANVVSRFLLPFLSQAIINNMFGPHYKILTHTMCQLINKYQTIAMQKLLYQTVFEDI